MFEYAQMDMQWYHEAKTALTYYRQGKEAAVSIAATRREMQAV